MIESLTSVTTSVVETSLDGLAMQQRLIADNIANANSAGFKPSHLEFESALRAVLERQSTATKADTQARLEQLRTSIGEGELTRTADATGVQLDIEMALLNQTVLKYQALIQGLRQFGSLKSMAIAGEIK